MNLEDLIDHLEYLKSCGGNLPVRFSFIENCEGISLEPDAIDIFFELSEKVPPNQYVGFDLKRKEND